ncbi:hypothetical protein QBC40DRAFT_259478 [Triangularia verruculosa]|uniref:Uncharacterized protein n=1 Tax=Triangularia verruculosa TaxID=2587418 RepID=A0AAN7AQP1_9PEZI|nr:hypothetical protein QBC40DRAFT_259478 [Triangularia verruculosa]
MERVKSKTGDAHVEAGDENPRQRHEHAVTPEGKRRFALTARFVDPSTMELQSGKGDALLNGC